MATGVCDEWLNLEALIFMTGFSNVIQFRCLPAGSGVFSTIAPLYTFTATGLLFAGLHLKLK